MATKRNIGATHCKRPTRNRTLSGAVRRKLCLLRVRHRRNGGPTSNVGLVTASSSQGPVVEEVLGFEDLPVGCLASRRVVVRWSDGSEEEGLRWYGDEVLVCEGDLVGKTREELRSLHFRRDREWLQS